MTWTSRPCSCASAIFAPISDATVAARARPEPQSPTITSRALSSIVACAGVVLNAWLPLARRSSIASAILNTQSGSSGPNFSMCNSRSIEWKKCLSPLSCGSAVTFPACRASSSSDVWIRLTTESRLKKG